MTEQLRAAQIAELARNWHAWAPDPDAFPDCDYPEIDCLRHRLPRRILAAAERRAAALGVGADQVLIATGFLSEESYLVELADWLGLRFAAIERFPRAACALSDAELVDAARTAQLRLDLDGGCALVVVPRGMAARALIRWVRRSPEHAHRIFITSSRRLRRFVERHGHGALGRRAASTLRAGSPRMSAGRGDARMRVAWSLATAMVAASAITAPATTWSCAGVALATVFLAWTVLRVVAATTVPRRHVRHEADDHRLPLYSVLVPLNREAAVVDKLLADLRALDYPPEKLDIKFILELDDAETHAALARQGLEPQFEIMFAPAVGPRTKPKALNAALPFVRGAFTAVFDAEDRPGPDQLRRALDVFLTSGAATACVQARLTIDNTDDGWLTRMFTAEYAALFDVVLPGLAERRLPLPLGGSSNHFETTTLRAVGAWDAYNVTEDADLGMRLARLGYRTAVIPATTAEEAPAETRRWIRQRTRWFKGWMQTWSVHMRTPIRLWRDLGWRGFVSFQLLIGGTVLASLAFPLVVLDAGYRVATGSLIPPLDNAAGNALLWLCVAGFAAGYLTSSVLGLVGLARRGLIRQSPVLLLVLAHWALLSVAAWRALLHLFVDPWGWEKTEHGRARSSRLDAGERAKPIRTQSP